MFAQELKEKPQTGETRKENKEEVHSPEHLQGPARTTIFLISFVIIPNTLSARRGSTLASKPYQTYHDRADLSRPGSNGHQPQVQTPWRTDSWDAYDSLFYNAWLCVDIEPTHVLDETTVKRFGFLSDLQEMIRQLGFGTMATRPYVLYHNLVRQFIATAHLSYTTTTGRVACDGILSFFSRGIRYQISISNLCEIYGFDPAAATISVPEFPRLVDLWDIISTDRWSTQVT